MRELWNTDAPGIWAVVTWLPNGVLWAFITALCLISLLWAARSGANWGRKAAAGLLGLASAGITTYFLFNIVWREEPPVIRGGTLWLHGALLLLAGVLIFRIVLQVRHDLEGPE